MVTLLLAYYYDSLTTAVSPGQSPGGVAQVCSSLVFSLGYCYYY